MLYDYDPLAGCDGLYHLISEMTGDGIQPGRIQQGVYRVAGFGGSGPGMPFPEPHWEHYPEFEGWRGPYGVADNVAQVLEKYPELQTDENRKFTVTVRPVRRELQSAQGGWRYHKWDEYIGVQDPQHEYLYDDKHIDEVLCFHIYEFKG